MTVVISVENLSKAYHLGQPKATWRSRGVGINYKYPGVQ